MKGKLEFVNLFFHSINLHQDDGSVIDVTTKLKAWLNINNNKKIIMKRNFVSFNLTLDETSDSHLEYKEEDNGILFLLRKNQNFGFTDIGAYLPQNLEIWNGRQVKLEINDESIMFSVDPNEDVPARKRDEPIDAYTVKEICKIGQNKETCIFTTVSGNGFECAKFGSLSRILLERYAKGSMNANRIGNCKLVP